MLAGYRAKRALTVVLVPLMGGCVATRSVDVGVGVVPAPSPHPYEPDIPLPVGFILADQSSEEWASGSLRYVRHCYRGPGGAETRLGVRRFYRQQMPLVRWAPLAESDVHGRCTMSFERETESCVITIAHERRAFTQSVVVTVLITPIARKLVDR